MRRDPAAVVTVIVLPLLLFSSAHGGFDSAGISQWQILTNRNFSSEIRLHPRILLMVTIPWSGEAQSLMKQLGKLVADQPEKHGHLRLMVVYKNSQKMIADVLGAAEDINLYYYHQSISYKYHGRFVAEKIVYSLNYFMTLQSEEIPLKPLNTKNELEYFLNSTDKAVLLIELCGWSSQLFHKRIVKKFTSSAQLNYSENDEMLRTSLFEEVGERLPFDMKNQKGLENEGLSSGFENELTDSHLSGDFCWANNSALAEMEYEAADLNFSCIEEEFKQFKSFFSKFKLLARDFLLSPERTRFGIISERSLLPYVGVNTMGAWLVTLQFNGCPSCSTIIETIDDLKNILQEHYPPVMQLDLDGHNPEPAFPASRPSIVLFIDRLSDSPLIRESSKSALDVVRMLAEYCKPSYRMIKGAYHGHSQSPTTQTDSESRGTVISDLPHLRFIKDSSSTKLVKDTMEIVISKDQSILSDQSASYTQGNAVYDALLDFINKRNLVRNKQTKISLLAKEIGFQLLSDDFEVQVADSSPYYKEQNQLSGTDKQKVLRTEDQTSEHHLQPSEDFVNQNGDLLAKVDEPVIGDGMQAALEDVEDNIPKYLEIASHENSNTNEDDKSWGQNDMGSLICHDENLLQGTCMEKDSIDASGCSSSSKGAEEKVSLVCPSEDFARDGWAQVEETIMNTDDPTVKLHQEAGEDSVNQNEHTVTRIGDQTFKLHIQPIEDSVNQNDDLLFAVEDHVVDDYRQAGLEDAEDDVQKYQQTATVENGSTNEDNKSCEQNDMESLTCHDENSLLEQQVHSVGICMETDTIEAFGCKSTANGTAEKVSVVGPSENFAGGDAAQAEENMLNKLSKEHNERQPFQCSFFFIDGGYRLLNSLTGGFNIPSLVLLDPVEQHHYVFNEDIEIDYSSLIIFVEKFLNGSLSPYQPSASSIMSAKEAPQPPFVNLDFHEVDAIPQVTTNTFCEMVFGFKPCVTENTRPLSQVQHLGAAWKKDVLVLFGLSWCGFCQRMELLVREVFHAFKNLKGMLKCESNVINPMCFQDSIGDMVEYSLPSIFLMDCLQNDCGSFLKAVGRNEYYPQLLLYSAKNKSAIPYEGDMLVVNIIKFLASEGRNSQYFNKYKGYLWKHTNSKTKPMPQDSSPVVMSRDVSLEKRGHVLVSGSVLSATDKLREAIPFDKSAILITVAEEGQQAFQGIIINKPMRWSAVFDDLDKDLEPLKEAPLFYGGPVRAVGLPLVSLARNPTVGYTKVISDVYFGNPAITRMAIEGIKSGDRSANDYWFFLGYCSWNGDQIVEELAQGAWHLSAGSIGRLNWPKS